MSIEPHLVVTGHNPTGYAMVAVDSHPDPITVGARPGAEFYLMWGTADGTPKVGEDDPAPVVRPYFPGVGGSRVVFVRWAPRSSDPEPASDPQQVADPQQEADEVTLRPGACVVQLGTRHTWQNRTDQPALMCSC